MEAMLTYPDGSILRGSAVDRRIRRRVQSRITLTVSYVQEGQFVMADGVLSNLSQEGVEVRINRPLKSGMTVALFIARPDAEDDFCIPEAHVSWATDHWFGVAFTMLQADAHHELLPRLAHQDP